MWSLVARLRSSPHRWSGALDCYRMNRILDTTGQTDLVSGLSGGIFCILSDLGPPWDPLRWSWGMSSGFSLLDRLPLWPDEGKAGEDGCPCRCKSHLHWDVKWTFLLLVSFRKRASATCPFLTPTQVSSPPFETLILRSRTNRTILDYLTVTCSASGWGQT